jgi:hypothetical protein
LGPSAGNTGQRHDMRACYWIETRVAQACKIGLEQARG